MNTVIILLNFISVLLLLNTSKEAILNNGIVEKLMQKNIKKIKIIGLLIIVLSFFTSTLLHGVTTGILINLFFLSITLSLIILFNPLKVINYKIVVLFFIISILLELLIL
jgi:hypothetical protein